MEISRGPNCSIRNYFWQALSFALYAAAQEWNMYSHLKRSTNPFTRILRTQKSRHHVTGSDFDQFWLKWREWV